MDDQSCVMEALRLAGSIILENGGETYRVEDTVDRLGRALGAVDVQSFSVPSGMFITVSFPDGTSQTKIYRAHGRGTHLKKVDDVNRISRLAAAGSVSPEQALDALRKIQADGPAFHPAWRLFANAAHRRGNGTRTFARGAKRSASLLYIRAGDIQFYHINVNV